MQSHKCVLTIKFVLTIGTLMLGGFFIYLFSVKREQARTKNISSAVYNVLDHYRILYDIDKHSVEPTSDTTPQVAQGTDQCLRNLAYFVTNNLPITMLLVGFPFKSANHEKKTVGPLPDMAERKSLEYLQGIINEMKSIYIPGAKIIIFCDGIFFAEFFDIPFTDVIAYEKALRSLIADLSDISLITSEDMLKTNKLTSLTDINKLIDQYPPSNEQFKAFTKNIPETALKRFALELDYPQGRLLLKKHTLKEIAFRLLARETRLRAYIAKTFPSPEFFRLTVHFSPDLSKKFGIRLSPISDITPYHGVLVQENDSWSIRLKKDVDKQKYDLRSMVINGVRCWYFKRI